jgi:hypothetical protein
MSLDGRGGNYEEISLGLDCSCIELRAESDLTDFGDLITLGMNDLKAKGYRETDE